MNISKKCGLVLGASRGIGLAIAQTLADKGARLALPWFDWPEDVEAMCNQFHGTPAGHITMKADLRKREDVAQVVKQITTQFGRLDFLINNIERGGMPIIHGSYDREINQEQWQREMETTLHAKWQVFNQCVPLLNQAEQAAVINISSIAGVVGRSGPAGIMFNDGYAAANRGVNALTQTWARQGAPSIRVNEIMLGFFDTRHGPGTRGWTEMTTKEKQAIINHTLVGRTGKVEEVVQAVLFLLENGDFITGATLTLDGGYTLGGENIPPMPAGVI
ncbi:MAG: 3-oxoacyl-ACP reductase [Desulfobulbus propionicus]|nr:MAG: 3-oxoacyl-ACP reductase [Desulfobulbus propionicus]